MTIDEWLHIIQHKGLDGITNRVDATVELVELLEELQRRRKSHYTNRDRFLRKISAMSDRELANLYCGGMECRDCQFVCEKGCFNKLTEWFKQESENG